MNLPPYKDLPPSPADTGARSAWGVFGAGDQLGRVGLMTDATLAAAAAELRSGRRFDIGLPLNHPDPCWNPNRKIFSHHVFQPRSYAQDDYIDGFYLQRSTQWDGLRHIRSGDGRFWGGVPPEEAGAGGGQLGIEHWVRHGMAGRGVLVDVAGYAAQAGMDWHATQPIAITPDLLRRTLEWERAELRQGDVLMLRTGYTDAYWAGDAAERQRMGETHACPGLEATDAMAQFLWDSGVAVIAADNPGVEVVPVDRSQLSLHQRLIPLLGFALGELFIYGELARHCAEDGRYTCLFVGCPLHIEGAVGSPANAMAMK